MGFSEKSHQVNEKPHQVDGGGLENEGKKWVIAGISIRTALKPISTKSRERESDSNDEGSCSTTPTAKEARIPERSLCPPAPRKRRPSRCHYNGVREFFTPPDLETVFIRHVERAN